MVRFLQHNKIEKAKWNKCIANSTYNAIYGNAWYLDACSPSWHALVLGDYEAVMPITWRKKAGIYYLYQPHFCQQLGVFSKESLSAETIKKFLEAIPDKYRFIEIHLNKMNQYKGKGFEAKQMVNYELDMKLPYEQIKTGYSKNTLRNISKKKQEVNICINKAKVSEAIRLFKKDKPKLSKQLGEDYFSTLLKLEKVVREKAEVEVVSAEVKGEIACAVVLFKGAGRSVLIFTGNSVIGKETGAMHKVVDHAIGKQGDTTTVFDFEGSNNQGLARFYASFGAKETVYLHLRKNNLPALIKWMKG